MRAAVLSTWIWLEHTKVSVVGEAQAFGIRRAMLAPEGRAAEGLESADRISSSTCVQDPLQHTVGAKSRPFNSLLLKKEVGPLDLCWKQFVFRLLPILCPRTGLEVLFRLRASFLPRCLLLLGRILTLTSPPNPSAASDAPPVLTQSLTLTASLVQPQHLS